MIFAAVCFKHFGATSDQHFRQVAPTSPTSPVWAQRAARIVPAHIIIDGDMQEDYEIRISLVRLPAFTKKSACPVACPAEFNGLLDKCKVTNGLEYGLAERLSHKNNRVFQITANHGKKGHNFQRQRRNLSQMPANSPKSLGGCASSNGGNS